MWDKREYNFGDVKSGESYYVTFNYIGTSKIKKVTPSCSCSVATHTDNSVTVKYTAPQFPPHLKVMGIKSSVDVKNITVKTKDDHEHLLTVKAVLTI